MVNVDSTPLNAYWKWDKAAPDSFCDYVLEQIDWSKSGPGLVVSPESKGVVDENLRRTDVIWVPSDTPVGCFLQTFMTMANSNASWNFSIYSMEDVQIGKYCEEVSGCYDWHTDTNLISSKAPRKLSVVMMLSDPKDFEGGRLEIDGIDIEIELLPKKGSLVVFPSFLKHRVTPVTAGVRHTAVSWMLGPFFR